MKKNNTDIKTNSFIYKTNKVFHPYFKLMRLDRPIGFWLLFFPCLWSLTLVIEDVFSYEMLSYGVLFFVGSVVMRGAGCVFNDIVDYKFDKLVERTALRPIPKGEISRKKAFIFMLFLLFLGFLVLISFNKFSIFLGISSLILVFIYPFMKRVTFFPQAWLGLTFNWGALLGYSVIKESLSLTALYIYIAGFFWTLGYDTIYAHQDKQDDILIGVKSTALKFGQKTKKFVNGFYFLTFIFMFLALVAQYSFDMKFLLVFIPCLQLFWQLKKLDIDDSKQCLRLFKSNFYFGLFLFLFIFCMRIWF